MRELPTDNRIIYATSDGGRTWHEVAIPSSATADESGFHVIDAAHAIVQLRKGLLATSDGGRTWREVSLPAGETFGLGAQFLTPTEGWYLDLAAYPNQPEQPTAMWWTSNGGASWTELWRVDAQHHESGGVPLVGTKLVLGFANPSLGWLSVYKAPAEQLMRTSDGGHSWTRVALPLQAPLMYLQMVFLQGRSAILLAQTTSGWFALRSLDAGASWQPLQPIPILSPLAGTSIDRPAFVDVNHWVVADGAKMKVTFDGGETWDLVQTSVPRSTAALHDLWFASSGAGWATAENGVGGDQILHTSDGGSHWTHSTLPGLA